MRLETVKYRLVATWAWGPEGALAAALQSCAKPRALCRQRCNSKCVSEQTFYRLMQSFALVLFE